MAQADLAVALGSRLGPFGTLPQNGMDYWPKDQLATMPEMVKAYFRHPAAAYAAQGI